MPIERDDVLTHACDLFLEEGVEGFSMRALAERVGVTAPALYRHFDDREELLLAVVDEAYQAMIRHLQQALEGPTPAERFRRAGRGYLDFALEQPRYYQIVYASPEWMGVEDVGDVRERHACAIGQFWHDRVRECIDAGLLREADPRDVALTMWAHAHGLISIYLQGMVELGEDEFRSLYMASSRRALAGMATPTFFEGAVATPGSDAASGPDATSDSSAHSEAGATSGSDAETPGAEAETSGAGAS